MHTERCMINVYTTYKGRKVRASIFYPDEDSETGWIESDVFMHTVDECLNWLSINYPLITGHKFSTEHLGFQINEGDPDDETLDRTTTLYEISTLYPDLVKAKGKASRKLELQ